MKTLTLIGMPLDEKPLLPAKTGEVLANSEVIIGESRKMTERYLSKLSLLKEVEVFYLDNQAPKDQKAMLQALDRCKTAALFSDTGMPILFDPGKDVLDHCRAKGFQIRTLPSATSWATAAAVSGWEPPLVIAGFPPQETSARTQWLEKMGSLNYPWIVMDTPYRYRALLEQCLQGVGNRKCFLAWEIAKDEERYFWGSVSELIAFSEKNGLQKGEFILILSPK